MSGIVTDKDEVIQLVREYLKENSLCDVTSLIEENCPHSHSHTAYVRDVANKMKVSGEFEIEAEGIGDMKTYFARYPVKKSWAERNPVKDKWRSGFITAAFSLIVGWLLILPKSRQQDRIDTRQDKHFEKTDSVINNLEKRLMDYEKKGKPVISDSNQTPDQ